MMLLNLLEDRGVLIGGLIGFALFCLAYWFATIPTREVSAEEEIDQEEKVEERDFTYDQLRVYDGVQNEKVFIAVCGEVFDVSENLAMYGPNGSYGIFAGHDCSRCLAKMSFEQSELDGDCENLSASEQDQLQEWHTKFKYVKCYPVVGKVSKTPPPETRMTRAQLKDSFKSTNSKSRVHPPLLFAVRGKVYDASYGGWDHYGPGGPYHRFCGYDASRALAKMSLESSDIQNSDLSDLTEKEIKILDDWHNLFIRKYPQVATLVD